MTDANMNPGAWRLTRLPLCTTICTMIALALAAQDDTASKFVSDYETATAEGRDLIAAPQNPLDTSSIANHLHPQTVTPLSALSGSAFLASDGAIVKLAGSQGCLSIGKMVYSNLQTKCAMVSLASLTATLGEARADAANAFACHVLAQKTGTPSVRFADCFLVKDDAYQSLSEVLISNLLAFAISDSGGRAIFPENTRAEEGAQKTKAGIWANVHVLHPYGERYRSNPSRNSAG